MEIDWVFLRDRSEAPVLQALLSVAHGAQVPDK
jgi:hypothetical protein